MFSRRIYLLQLLIAFLCASALSPILFTSHAFALADPITVSSETDTVSFPKEIDFQVSVQDPSSTITQATLTLSSRAPHYFQVDRTVPISNPAQTLTLQWHEDITGDHFVYPGTSISYTWQFHDQAGHLHVQPAQNFTVIDTRFNWQHLSQGLVQVYWYSQTTDFGQIILSQAIDNLKRISTNLGGSLQHPINLWVYQNSDDFHGSLPPQVHEWVGGIAFPSLNEASIVVDDPNAVTLTRDMPHELTHLVFHQLIQQGILAPLWFDEGMAVYNQTYHEPEMTQRFKRALTTNSLLRLNIISYAFPTDAQQAYLAYAQSWNLISYMYNTFGQAKMARLVTLMSGKTTEFNQDVQQALGEDELHLEDQWRVQLHQPSVLTPYQVPSTQQPSHNTPPNVQIGTDSNAPLLILAGLLLILLPALGISGLLVYQRRSHQKKQLVQQAQQIMSSTFSPPPSAHRYYPPYAPPPAYPNALYESYGQPIPYADPARYTPPGAPQYNAGNPAGTRPIPPGQPTPPQAPTWNPVYPGQATHQHGNQHIEKLPPQPLEPGQEYLSQPPQKQAPQE